MKRKELLLCGGAVGHLMHLYDNRDLTFAEIKELLTAAADGRLERVSEKLDGMNLVVSWDVAADDLRAARNSGDIKGGGMDAEAIASKFFDRGNVGEAFTTAFKVLRDAIGTLPDKTKVAIFGPAANVWYSAEIIYTKNPNVINYDSNNVVFHGWPVFEVHDGEITHKEDATGVKVLQKNVEQMQKAITVRNWRVRGPAMLRLKGISDGSILQKTLSTIESAQNSAGVSDSDTIGDYLNNLMQEKVANLGLPREAADALVSRCLGLEGSPTLNDVKKMLPRELHVKASSFAKASPDVLKRFVQPLEDSIHAFAIEVLRGLHSTLIDDSDAEVMRLRSEVAKAIRAIEASGQEIAMDVLHRQMQKLGNLENIAAAMEGVVFIYKGNAYKFTGSFAPANQILGLFKYGRSGVKIPAIENHLRRYVKMMTEKKYTPGNVTSQLRRFIREAIRSGRLVEAGEEPASLPPRVGFGQRLRSGEGEAKQRFEAAKRAYDAIRTYFTELPDGEDPDWKEKHLVLIDDIKANIDPSFKYPVQPKFYESRLETATDNYERALRAYARFDPSIVKYQTFEPLPPKTMKKVKKAASAANRDTDDSRAPANVGEGLIEWSGGAKFTNRWVSWPENIKKLSGVGFGKQTDDERGEKMGTGPGERWLAFTFGGKVMGGGVSYDVMIGDTKCESKELGTASSTIRPGTEGLRAYEPAREKLEVVVRQLRGFVRQYEEVSDALEQDEDTRGMMRFISDFVKSEYSNIVGKGEITEERFQDLQTVMELTNKLKEDHGGSSKIKGKPTVKFSTVDEPVKVNRPTYINIVKKVEDEEPDAPKDMLKDEDAWSILLSVLKDESFNDPVKWFNDFEESIKIDTVFEQVDGVFIVNEDKGFCWVPKSQFRDAFEFASVSQAKPKFRFKWFSSAPQVKFEELQEKRKK